MQNTTQPADAEEPALPGIPRAPPTATTTTNTASTTPQGGATPLQEPDLNQSRLQPQDNSDVIMGGGSYETRGNVRGPGPVSSATGTHQSRAGGAPARMYMNEKIVPYLLEGMKIVAKDQPANPLQLLGEYLIQKSQEIGETAGEQMTT
ncbi:COMPASS (complex proteins associated with Set1p) component [Myotisia sp. PD_48]|nr:COMPASS (complex proteins associated with Set1p) component [Myotisia sp. PD_48]